MNHDMEAFAEAYKVYVTYIYDSKYGKLQIQQPVYVVEEKGKWRVLWDYSYENT